MFKYGCIELVLDSRAITYIKNEILPRGHTLARYLLKTQALEAGRVVTFLPPEVNEKQLYDFKFGLVLPMPPKTEWRYIDRPDGKREVLAPIPTADEGLISVIRAYLEKEPDNLCILEEQSESAEGYRKNPPPIDLRESLLTCKNDAYFFTNGTKTNDEIRKLISYAEYSWVFIGALTSFPGGGNLLAQHKEITENQLRTLVEKTEIIFVGAYDHEGYLIWHKA